MYSPHRINKVDEVSQDIATMQLGSTSYITDDWLSFMIVLYDFMIACGQER